MSVADPNIAIKELVNRWCDRRELGELASLLPAWLGNNGLTDGWQDLHDALKHTHAAGEHLPAEEREMLKVQYIAIDVALRNR